MGDFNKELINKVKLFQNELDSQELLEEKYSFLRYVFKNLESVESDYLDICEEEFRALNCNIDGCYYDEDNSTYNLYLVKYSDSNNDESVLSEQEIAEEYNKIINFLKKIVKKEYTDFGEESVSYEIAQRVYRELNNSEIVVSFFSNYIVPEQFQKNNIEDIGSGKSVSFRTYDLLDLKNKFNQLNKESFETNFLDLFQTSIVALRISSTPDFDVYMCSMRGTWLAQLYKDNSIQLLEANVRSYLKRTAKVNAGILDTVKTSPEEFVTYNNGISAVATDIKTTSDKASKIVLINSIYNFQIVNGGQTTATLYECYKDKLIDNLMNLIVPVKLTVVKNISNSENLIRNISIYSNTQTAIKKSDPPSNLPFYVTMKKLSKSCVSSSLNQSYMCYFERTNGEYDTEYRRNNGAKRFTNSNPKDKKFTKIDLAIAINCWEQHPNIVCEGKEKCFTYFNNNVKSMLKDPDETFFKYAYANIILYKKLDKLAKKMGLTYKSNVIAYTLSLLSFIYHKKITLMEVWDLKDITEPIKKAAIELLPKVHSLIANAPKEHPEPRMWARKAQCWEQAKTIVTNLSIPLMQEPYEFFADNEVLTFIEDDNNFYNSILWMKLLIWDSKYKMLNKKQQTMIKYVRSIGDNKDNKLTKKQVDYVKDIFFFAVKSGFQYK